MKDIKQLLQEGVVFFKTPNEEELLSILKALHNIGIDPTISTFEKTYKDILKYNYFSIRGGIFYGNKEDYDFFKHTEKDFNEFLKEKGLKLEKTIIPFDLEKVKNGASLVTRGGLKAKYLADNYDSVYYPILATIFKKSPTVYPFNLKGRYSSETTTNLDLLIEDYQIVKDSTELTIGEIENLLGIKNLKIVK